MCVTVLQKTILHLLIIMMSCSAIMNRVEDSHVLVKDPGENAVFPCQIKTGEAAFWFHNNQILQDIIENRRGTMDNTKRIYVNSVYRNQWDLVIENIKLSDAGEYQCKSRTTLFKKYQLFIRGPVKLDSTSPSLVSVKEFDEVVLWCNASGKPDPEIKWFVVTQFPNREEETDIGIEGPMLEIRNISRHCMGSYRCHASNKYLELVTVNASFEVQVVFEPTAVLTNSVNGIETNESRIRGKIGDEVRVVCDVSYFPPGTIQLYHVNNLLAAVENGQVTEENIQIFNHYDFERSSIRNSRTQFIMKFRLQSRESEGRYTCVASNIHGNTKLSVWINIKE